LELQQSSHFRRTTISLAIPLSLCSIITPFFLLSNFPPRINLVNRKKNPAATRGHYAQLGYKKLAHGLFGFPCFFFHGEV